MHLSTGIQAAAALLLCLLIATALADQQGTRGALGPTEVDEMLKAHNDARAARNIPPLRWSPALAEMAQAWAVHLAEVGRFEHHPQRVGQNLFYGSGIANITPSFVVQSWLDESKDYDEHKARCSDGADCGHFTQVIWKGSKVLGCGAASGGGRQFWACFYNPPGNIIGSRPY